MAEQENKRHNKETNQQQNNQGKRILKIVLAVVGVVLLLGALGVFLLFQLGENIFEEVTNTEFERTEEGIKVESDEGSFETQTQLSDDFPEAVPLYDGAEVVSSSRIQDNEDGQTTFTASFNTSDEVNEVADYYETTLEDEGWEISQTSSFNNTKQISATKNDLQITVFVNPDATEDGLTSLTINAVLTDEAQ